MAFHADAAMAFGAMPLLAWAVAAGPRRLVLPHEALALVALGAVPLVQRAVGLIDFGADAWLAVAYVSGVAAAVVIGARAQALRPWVMPNALFLSFAIAAVSSTLLMLAQWLQWDGLGTLLFALPPGSRLSANVGQPNQLATLLVWGLLALCWAFERRAAHGAILSLLAAALLAALAATQSRAGALELVLVGGALAHFRRQLRLREHAPALGVLAVWFIAAWIAWPVVSETFGPGQGAAQSLQQRLATGKRLLHWGLLLDAVALKPWFGWGWNQVVHAQGELALLHPPTHEVLQYGHNLVLDLVLWNGVPIGLVTGLGLVAWCIWQVRLARSAERLVALLVVAVFLVHAMVELPHGYLLFLLPVGLMVGALHMPMKCVPDIAVSRGVAAVPLATLAITSAVIVHDYRRVEEAWMAHRFRAARIGSQAQEPVPDALLLSNLQALLQFMRTEPQASMSAEDLELLRRVARRYPSPGGLFRYAWALALNGQAGEATRTLALLCKIHDPAQCAAAKKAWLVKSGAEHPELASAWPAEL